MATVKAKDRETEARERFDVDVAEHKMTVLRDDGLYRHLRFQKPGTSCYYFDLVTWPGHLVVCGDMGDYHFARISDMFEFFAGSRQAPGINPYYWGEKLQGPRRGRDSARSYSKEAFKAQVREWLDDYCRDHYPDQEAAAAGLAGAVDDQLLDDWDGGLADESEAHRRLRDFTHQGDYPISDSWEWDLREFDFHYLWCCWAIVWGIARYREAT